MKAKTLWSRLSLLALLIATTAGSTLAYEHDSRGWIDENHHHHAFIHHNGHRGYWDHDKGGQLIFIAV